MPTIAWLAIIGGILLMWWLWTKYGTLYTTIRENPVAVDVGQSAYRYYQDIVGLLHAYDTADKEDGNFMSRLGAFVGALPK